MASLQRTASIAMPSLEKVMKSRCTRGDLEKGVAYIQVNRKGRTKVGKFVNSGYQGSGDGMELVLIFELDGKNHTVREEMWGSIRGDELSYFEKDE